MDNKEQTTSGWFIKAYEKYEDIVSIGLTGLIAVIVLIAFIRLSVDVYQMLVIGMLDPLDHKVFKHIFGMIMTLLIAMEFKHSIVKVIERKDHVVQVKTVLLIALLALSRKFIILDIKTMNPGNLAALALSVLALGVVYRLIREDDHARTAKLKNQGRKNRADGKNSFSISGNKKE
ncbi:MAG TPA: diguanylate cyclase [Desulfobulbaceae bacterium]|nr:diguanylate cyclase [Desulfobulbaceae bacterium]